MGKCNRSPHLAQDPKRSQSRPPEPARTVVVGGLAKRLLPSPRRDQAKDAWELQVFDTKQ